MQMPPHSCVLLGGVWPQLSLAPLLLLDSWALAPASVVRDDVLLEQRVMDQVLHILGSEGAIVQLHLKYVTNGAICGSNCGCANLGSDRAGSGQASKRKQGQ